ncbi:MAG: serine/threonine protein phosphatase [Cytophagales bacterium]|nr:MAG: serine/threonine protein phosphatase [Cytophagales bacterium]
MSKFVIGDIHGCANTLKNLILFVLPKKKDNIFYFLGDYINKGPDSKGVLDFLIELKNNYTCHFLRGNHEQDLLAIYEGLYEQGNFSKPIYNTLQSFGVSEVKQIPDIYIDFLRQTVFSISVNNYLLVHAGFDFAETASKNIDFMLYTKKFTLNSNFDLSQKVIIGHSPCSIIALKNDLKNNSSLIKLDTGCVYRLNSELGLLSALDIDDCKLYSQVNIEEEYTIELKKL